MKADGVNSFGRRLDSRYGYLEILSQAHIYYGNRSIIKVLSPRLIADSPIYSRPLIVRFIIIALAPEDVNS